MLRVVVPLHRPSSVEPQLVDRWSWLSLQNVLINLEIQFLVHDSNPSTIVPSVNDVLMMCW